MVSVVYTSTNLSSKDPVDSSAWLEHLQGERTPEEVALLRRACEVAEKAHTGQTRVSGEPYFQHVLAVANILAELKMDSETLAAALLHDVVEDTSLTLADIEAQFGENIAHLVDGVTKMDAIDVQSTLSQGALRDQAKAETLRKMLLAMVEDVRVVLVKLADRLHNMRTLAALPAERRYKMARETMDIFAPLANRLGIWQIKWELEDLAFRHLEPDTYKRIAKLLNERRVDREQYIDQFIRQLDDSLRAVGIEATVTGRPKHIYSIYRKMARKDVDYNKIYDVRAARVMVNSVKDCYAVLGIVHSLWQYVPGEFDDYIATPKANNYRSLHTAVIGPQGKVVEVQIRTFEMHQHSEFGVAAHWRYKEGVKRESGFEKKIAWLRQVLEWKDEVGDATDFVDKIKSDVFRDRVYVFTPQGEVIDLPRGATPLDFAYHIHSEVGHRCRGAKVNGRIVPLTYILSSGEQVEVLTVKRGGPSRDWLNPHLGFLASSKAKAKVQHWFKQQNFDQNVAEGRQALERELSRMGYRDINLEKLSKELNFDRVDDLFAAIGRGDLRFSQVFNAVARLQAADVEAKPEQPVVSRPTVTDKVTDDVYILGVGNLLTHFAQCCKPLPGDDIRGFITRGRGVTIHRSDCRNILRYETDVPERVIHVQWGERTSKVYPVTIRVSAYDRQGLLRDITTIFANEKVNVIAVATKSNVKTNLAHLAFTAEIDNLEKLSRVLAKIDQLPNVLDARRENA